MTEKVKKWLKKWAIATEIDLNGKKWLKGEVDLENFEF